MPTEQKAIIYCRVSTTRQAAEDRSSLSDQETNCTAYAAKKNIPVVEVVHSAESAWVLDKRSTFRELLAKAERHEFNVLIVDRMNRFTRSESLADYFVVQHRLQAAGVTLLSAREEYAANMTGELHAVLDAFVSAREQENRRLQSAAGKRGRVARGAPNPGSRPLYGYVWIDEQKVDKQHIHKTQMAKTGDEAQQTVERVWHYFLTAEHPTLRRMSILLNEAGVRSPHAYFGIQGSENRWTGESIRKLLTNSVYWGGDENGMVPTFTDAKNIVQEPVMIPAYAPGYVTLQQAAQVHARLTANKKYAARNRHCDWGVLLYGGMARCGQCGWALSVHMRSNRRKDGGRFMYYRCQRRESQGVNLGVPCTGVNINTKALDQAVILALDENLNKGDLLARVFAAWDANSVTLSAGSVSIRAAIKETEQKVANLTERLASFPLGDAAAASLETAHRMYASQLPELHKRLVDSVQVEQAARNNVALRDELREWFSGWLYGFHALPRIKQRQFLESLGAKIELWPQALRTPCAVLTLALPATSAGVLPAPPVALELDTTAGAELAAEERIPFNLRVNGVPVPNTPPSEVAQASAAEVMQAIDDTLATEEAEQASGTNAGTLQQLGAGGRIGALVKLGSGGGWPAEARVRINRA